MVDTATLTVFIIIYLVATMYLGYLGYKKTKASEDFMLAGRKIHPWVLGLSYGATFISTSAIVGFGGVSAVYGMGLIWLTMLNIAVGVLLAFIVFGKRTRKLGQELKARTFPELMGRRFNSNFMHFTTAILIMVAMPLYASAVMIGGSQFIKETLGWDLTLAILIFALLTAVYVVYGGLRAVMYTDAMQGMIMVIGLAVLLILTFVALGGVDVAFAKLSQLPSEVPPDQISGAISKGFTGWTSMPELGSEYWLVLVTTIIMGVGIGVLAQPQLIVRFMTAADSRSLNRAIPIGGLFILITTGVAYTVGPLTNVWFFENKGMTSLLATGSPPNTDAIMPLFINLAMPEAFTIIFMLVLLAAAMSTLSSIFHTLGTTAGFDFWGQVQRWRENKGSVDAPSLSANRIGTVIMIVASVALSFAMPFSIIARATAMFMGLCAAAFLPAYVHGMFSKNPYTLAAKMSLVTGGVTWFLWTIFVHIKESSVLGISQFLFNKPAVLDMPWQVVDPLIIALPASILALVVGLAYRRLTSEEGEAPINGRAKPEG